MILNKKIIKFIIATLLIVLSILHCLIYWGVSIDDVYITFRYAKNLYNGYGLVYNPGEIPVEGFTSLFNTLLAWLYFYGLGTAYIPIKLTALSITVLFISYLLYLRFIPGFFASLFLIGSTSYAYYAMSGMENYLTVPLVFLIVYFGIKKDANWLWCLFSCLALIVRPEMQMIILLIIGYRSLIFSTSIFKGITKKSVLVIVFFNLGIYIFRYIYFGEVMPNTYYAKYTGGKLLWDLMAGASYLSSISPQYAITIATSIFLIFFIRDKTERILFGLILTIFIVFPVKIGGDDISTFPYQRLYLPLLGLIMVLFYRSDVKGYTPPLIFIIILLPFLSFSPALFHIKTNLQINKFSNNFTAIFKNYFISFHEIKENKLSDYLIAETPASEFIAVPFAGYIPFATRLLTIDLLGLNDRHISKILKRDPGVDTKFDAEYILFRKPYFYCDIMILDVNLPLAYYRDLSRYELYKLGAIRQGQIDILKDPRFSEGYLIDKKATQFANFGTCYRRIAIAP